MGIIETRPPARVNAKAGVSCAGRPGPVPGMTFYVEDRPIESDGLLVYFAPPAGGFDLTVEAPGLSTLALRAVNFSLGLPALTG